MGVVSQRLPWSSDQSQPPDLDETWTQVIRPLEALTSGWRPEACSHCSQNWFSIYVSGEEDFPVLRRRLERRLLCGGLEESKSHGLCRGPSMVQYGPVPTYTWPLDSKAQMVVHFVQPHCETCRSEMIWMLQRDFVCTAEVRVVYVGFSRFSMRRRSWKVSQNPAGR